MDEELADLLERARNHVMSPAEIVAQRESFMRAFAEPSDDDLSADELARRRAEAQAIPEHLRCPGTGPVPASWMVGNTKVYRSYADYCDD